jgi:hypothetical protein
MKSWDSPDCITPLDSPDLTLCYFFLAGWLKKELQGMNFTSQNEVISAVRVILGEIPVRTLSGVFNQWTERRGECITNGGDYV